MNARTHRKEDLLDFGGGNAFPVVADAHFQPHFNPTDDEAKTSSFGRGLHAVLHRILYQRLKGKRWH